MSSEPPPNWPTLATDWFVAHAEQFSAALARAYPDVDSELLHDAQIKALLDIASKPEAFDPERGTLLDFLIGAARRALRDLRRSDASRRRREEEKGKRHVAAEAAAARDILDGLANAELAELARAEAALTDEERAYLALWEQGIDDLPALTQALRIVHLPPGEQEISRLRTHKRIMKRLERFGERHAVRGGGP
jgi:hypothetical protein